MLADGVLHGLGALVDELGDETPTLLKALVVGIPYALVMMLPGIGGIASVGRPCALGMAADGSPAPSAPCGW